jgi:hypothetical protein
VAETSEWVLLAYRIPREPSTPRIAVWRKLRRLGAVQVLDGLVGLPSDARTKEHLEWIADEVIAAGGEANIWLARPATKAQERNLAAQMAAEVEADYDAVAQAARETLDASPGTRKRTASRLRRELKRIRQRDYFPQDGFERARFAVNGLDQQLDQAEVEAGR